MTTTARFGVPPETAPPKGACPVINWDFASSRPPLDFYLELDAMREASPFFYNEFGGTGGFWMLTRYDEVREAYQTPEIFSSDSVTVLDANPPYTFIPTHMKAPDHQKYRRLLNPRFAPATVASIEPSTREWCREVVGAFAGRGSCDAVTEFAGLFPTGVFLNILGLPFSDAPQLLDWVTAVFAGMTDPELQGGMVAAMGGISVYFAELLAERRARPRDPETDFMTFLITGEVDGRPLTDEEIGNICLVLVLAGLDTVKSQISYTLWHLATHPEDQQLLRDRPELVPTAVEEMLRAYAVVMDGRKVAEDVDFHGCPMKKGDMVMLTLPSATRDETVFPDATRVELDREHNNHVAFAAGPHRCLGAHLARQELAVAIQEWHRLVPTYSVAEGVELTAHGGQLGLDSLPLVWETPTTEGA